MLQPLPRLWIGWQQQACRQPQTVSAPPKFPLKLYLPLLVPYLFVPCCCAPLPAELHTLMETKGFKQKSLGGTRRALLADGGAAANEAWKKLLRGAV